MNAKVWGMSGTLEAPIRPMMVQDLLRHTAGLSYRGYAESQSPVDKLYDEADLFNTKITNAELIDRV